MEINIDGSKILFKNAKDSDKDMILKKIEDFIINTFPKLLIEFTNTILTISTFLEILLLLKDTTSTKNYESIQLNFRFDKENKFIFDKPDDFENAINIDNFAIFINSNKNNSNENSNENIDNFYKFANIFKNITIKPYIKLNNIVSIIDKFSSRHNLHLLVEIGNNYIEENIIQKMKYFLSKSNNKIYLIYKNNDNDNDNKYLIGTNFIKFITLFKDKGYDDKIIISTDKKYNINEIIMQFNTNKDNIKQLLPYNQKEALNILCKRFLRYYEDSLKYYWKYIPDKKKRLEYYIKSIYLKIFYNETYLPSSIATSIPNNNRSNKLSKVNRNNNLNNDKDYNIIVYLLIESVVKYLKSTNNPNLNSHINSHNKNSLKVANPVANSVANSVANPVANPVATVKKTDEFPDEFNFLFYHGSPRSKIKKLPDDCLLCVLTPLNRVSYSDEIPVKKLIKMICTDNDFKREFKNNPLCYKKSSYYNIFSDCNIYFGGQYYYDINLSYENDINSFIFSYWGLYKSTNELCETNRDTSVNITTLSNIIKTKKLKGVIIVFCCRRIDFKTKPIPIKESLVMYRYEHLLNILNKSVFFNNIKDFNKCDEIIDYTYDNTCIGKKKRNIIIIIKQ